MQTPSREAGPRLVTRRCRREPGVPDHLDAMRVPSSKQKVIAKHPDFDTSRELNRAPVVSLHCKLRKAVSSSSVHDDSHLCGNGGP